MNFKALTFNFDLSLTLVSKVCIQHVYCKQDIMYLSLVMLLCQCLINIRQYN